MTCHLCEGQVGTHIPRGAQSGGPDSLKTQCSIVDVVTLKWRLFHRSGVWERSGEQVSVGSRQITVAKRQMA